MDFEETMDNEELDLSEEVVEEPEEEAEELPTEDDVPETQEEPKAKDEPGYVQKRIDKALARERDSMRAAIMAEIEAQYAPIKERLLEMDAQELVRTGQVKDLELAKELIRLRNGQPVREENPQPREANGQFAPKEDPATMARIDMLKHQASRIKALGGPDVIAEWNSNEEIKNAVINGEMDFYDVAEQMRKPRKRPPSPMRSPNGVNGVFPNSIDTMTDAQFAALDKKLDEGVRFTIKR